MSFLIRSSDVKMSSSCSELSFTEYFHQSSIRLASRTIEGSFTIQVRFQYCAFWLLRPVGSHIYTYFIRRRVVWFGNDTRRTFSILLPFCYNNIGRRKPSGQVACPKSIVGFKTFVGNMCWAPPSSQIAIITRSGPFNSRHYQPNPEISSFISQNPKYHSSRHNDHYFSRLFGKIFSDRERERKGAIGRMHIIDVKLND